MTTPDWPGFDPDLLSWLSEAPSAPAGSPVAVMRDYSRRSNSISRARMNSALFAPSVRDQQVDGPGGPLTVRIFTPAANGGPVPLLVYFHGGGWVIGDLDTHLAHAHRLCVETGAVVVSVDYRLAPEYPAPAAFDDCLAATEWAAASAAAIGADPHLLVVAGDSAGGQLAASVAIARRDAGLPLAAQLLVYPVTTIAGRYEDTVVNADFPSRTAQAAGPGLTLASMVFFATTYASKTEALDWRSSPLAADLHGVAPAVVHTAAFDVLRDEGNRYAEALRSAGVAVIAREFPALNHAYFGLGGVSRAADAAATQAAVDLRDILGLAPLPTARP